MILLFFSCFSSNSEHAFQEPQKTIHTHKEIAPKKPTKIEPVEPPVGSRIISLYFTHPDQGSVEVSRRGPKHEPEQIALNYLYEGPSEEEKQKGLYLNTCKTTGATLLSIEKGLAIIQLQGDCGDCGSIGIYDSIVKTSKQFTSIQYVHVLDPNGKTQMLSKKEDARPACLEP